MSELIFGIHAVDSALRNDGRNVHWFGYDRNRKDNRLKELIKLAQDYGLDIEPLTARELDKLTNGARHQGVAVKYQGLEAFSENDLWDLLDKIDKPLLLILDGVTDPHNLGACLRTADAAGVDAVIAPKDKAVGLTPTVRKVASGAAEKVPFVQIGNLRRFLEQLQEQGIWVVGTSDAAEHSLYEVDFRGPHAIVMGAEGKGMRRLTTETCDQLVSIPMAGEVSSLNVSVATGVCLFEIVRQRLA